MHMNVHFAAGIIISMLLSSYLTEFQIIIIIVISILIDFDFIFSKFAENHNHRKLITHTFIPYIIFIIIGLILFLFNISELWIYFIIIGASGVFHIFLDSIDWGIMLFYPIKRDLKGGILSIPENLTDSDTRIPHCYFIITYYKSKFIKFIEIFFISFALFLLIIMEFKYLYLILGYMILLLIHINQYFKCKKKYPSF